MTNKIKLKVGQWVELNNGEQYEVQWQRSDGRFVVGSYLVMTGDGCYRSLGPSDPLSVARILPHIKLLNGDVLFEGDYAKRRDGEVVGPLRYYGGPEDSAPWDADGFWYHSDGRTNLNEVRHYDLIARADPPEAKTQDEPRLWRDMTNAEKGALLLAEHEGREVQKLDATVDGMAWSKKSRKKKYDPCLAYRIKPAEPVRETVVLYGADVGYGWEFDEVSGDNLTRITLPLIDGKMPTGTFTNEDGETIVVEELE